MSELTLHGRAEVHHLPGSVVLAAEHTWEVVGSSEALDALCAALPARVVDRWRGGVRLLFVNCVGLFDLGPLGRLDVRSGKWDQSGFDGLLRDLSRRATALPFAAGTGSSLPYDRALAADDDLLWHAFVYLRHTLSDAAEPGERLLDALRALLTDPHRMLTEGEDEVPTALAANVSPDVLLDLASGGLPLARVSNGRFAVADRMGGHMPLRVRVTRAEPTVDTPPNRFVKVVIDQALAVADRVAAIAKTGAMRAEAVSLRNRLHPVRRADLWNEVGPMVHFPSASTVLHRRRGYREVFRIAQRLRMSSRLPIDPSTVVGLLENKDIATLYELWTCFAVVDAVSAVLGPPPKADRFRRTELDLNVPWQYRVSWPGGFEVLYNASFTPQGALRSRSVQLRPDVLVRTPRGSHVFDAKFKVRWMRVAADDTDEDRERVGDYVRGDLYKMHTYRDALDEVVSAWVVYPGTEERAFEMPGGSIGAVPASPDALDPLFEVVRRTIL